MRIIGTVYLEDGKTPAEGITLFVYQTDATGRYNATNDVFNPRIHGWVRTDRDGHYEFSSIRPGPYPNGREPAHIHVHTFGPGRPEWFIDEYLFGDDPLLPEGKRALPKTMAAFSPVVELRRGADGVLQGKRDIRLEAPRK